MDDRWCDRCGSTMVEKTIAKADERGFQKVPDCPECTAATIYLRIPFGSEEKILSWLEKVINRQIQKALTERSPP